MIKLRDIEGDVRALDNAPIFRMATVTGTGGGGVYLQFPGDTEARAKPYKRCAGYTPATGHAVLVARISGTDIIIDRVV